MEIRVKLTDVRPHLSELIGQVEFGGKKIVIERFGRPTAALVSMADLKRIREAEEDKIAEPVDPVTGSHLGSLRLGNALAHGLAVLRGQGKTLDDVIAEGTPDDEDDE